MDINFRKGDNLNLSTHFKSSEFECPCGKCTDQHISKDLLDRLESLRIAVGIPLKITSGYRCEAHNKAVGGVENSSHTKGEAADVTCADLDKLLTEGEKIFDSIGDGRVNGHFCHFDTRLPKQPGNVKRRWTY